MRHPSFMIIAHRGASAYAPENTIAAFDKALDLGAAYNNRGHSYNELGRNQRAIEDFDEAIRLNSQYADAY